MIPTLRFVSHVPKVALGVWLCMCLYTQAICATYTSSATGGNWNAPGSWTCTTGPCGPYPQATDIVIINRPITLNISLSGTLSSLTINNGGSLHIQNNLTSAATTVNSGGSLNLEANFTGDVTLAGGGITTSGTSSRTITGSVSVNSNNQTVNNFFTPLSTAPLFLTGNMTLTTGTLTYSGGDMSVAALSVQNNGILTIGTAASGTGKLTLRSNGTMNGTLNIRKGGTMDASGNTLAVNANVNGNPTCDQANANLLVEGIMLVDNLSIEASCLFVSGVPSISPSTPPGFVKVQRDLTITQRGDMQIAGLYLVGGNVNAIQGNIDITGTGYFGVAGNATYQNNAGPVATLNYCQNSNILTCTAAASCPFPSAQNGANECSNVCRAYVCSGFSTSFPLPVDLISFTVEGDAALGHSRLEWVTAGEQNNNYFVVERSSNGFQFKELQQVKGGGTRDLKQLYRFTDTNPLSGINYYRLKQVDFDGKYTYSKIVSATFQRAGFTISPNPAQGKTITILWKAPVSQASIWIYNQLGHQVYSQQIAHSHSWEQAIYLQEELKKGVYLIKVQTDGQQFTEKMIVQN